ncbi:MAG TPA: glucose-6-phosphate dehydrogenase [Gemmatimonadaceae bacterium]
MPATAEPCVFVIFGGTGDLATRKLLPALYELHAQGVTASGCIVLGVARDPGMDDVRFRALAREALGDGHDPDAVARWAESSLHYQPVGEAKREDYESLCARIEALEREHELPGNRVFYLALPPRAFDDAVRCLGAVGLTRSAGWTRVVVEKPFGRDLASARALNDLLHEHFRERQIYRIDHYLGKETVQNLLVFRFANAMFETLWNREHIESVEITVAESLGVEERAGYYDKAGALRDMVQSHLTQLLALVAMEVPVAFEADAIRAEKIKALRSIAPIRPTDVVFGQYGRGTIDGTPVPGYREEDDVPAGSATETFVAIRLEIENWRWQGVPFFLRTGKRMARRLTEIEVKFRRAPVWMFRTVCEDVFRSNSLLLTLQPDEGFSLFFDVKRPGEPFHIKRLPLHFSYAGAFGKLPEAYRTLIHDVLTGNQTLFVHADETEAAWALYTPLLERRGAEPLHEYAAGTWGPEEADHFTGETPRAAT